MGTYEWENCPYCGRQVSSFRVGLASDTTIGPAFGKCPFCGGVFKTGKSEWGRKSALSKTGYFVRVVWWCIGAAIFGAGFGFVSVLVVLGMVFKTSDEQMFSVGLTMAFVVAVLAVLRVIYVSRREIKDSLEKTKGA